MFGIMGSLFGILGIFTFGLVFIPIGILCTLFAFFQGADSDRYHQSGCQYRCCDSFACFPGCSQSGDRSLCGMMVVR